ncbi:MAG: hypothetical protein IKH20_07320 [Clostridiales bacterium]|nr:hypothetical protein [Clostridiales bacterium]
MDFFALILAIGVGFGTACFIFASLLIKSNDIGNSIGSAYHYSRGVSFDRREDKISSSVRESFGMGYIREEERNAYKPGSDKKVEASVIQQSED